MKQTALVVLGLALTPEWAFAQSSLTHDGGADEASSLFDEVRRDYSSLGTEDCVSACKALASMRRATDRLCALDDGARCREARTKTDDAARRVHEACPTCDARAMTPSPVAPVPAPRDEATPTSASAESVRERGGCKSCAASPVDDPGGAAFVAIAALAVARILRRKARA